MPTRPPAPPSPPMFRTLATSPPPAAFICAIGSADHCETGKTCKSQTARCRLTRDQTRVTTLRFHSECEACHMLTPASALITMCGAISEIEDGTDEQAQAGL